MADTRPPKRAVFFRLVGVEEATCRSTVDVTAWHGKIKVKWMPRLAVVKRPLNQSGLDNVGHDGVPRYHIISDQTNSKDKSLKIQTLFHVLASMSFLSFPTPVDLLLVHHVAMCNTVKKGATSEAWPVVTQ